MSKEPKELEPYPDLYTDVVVITGDRKDELGTLIRVMETQDGLQYRIYFTSDGLHDDYFPEECVFQEPVQSKMSLEDACYVTTDIVNKLLETLGPTALAETIGYEPKTLLLVAQNLYKTGMSIAEKDAELNGIKR